MRSQCLTQGDRSDLPGSNRRRMPACDRRRPNMRRAAATVELAVCLPVLITLVFAAIEASNMVFTKQAVTAAAYEGARTAIRPDATSGNVQARVQEVLDARGVNGTSISTSPGDVGGIARGTRITVTVTAECNANTVGPSWYFTGRTLSVPITMVKE